MKNRIKYLLPGALLLAMLVLAAGNVRILTISYENGSRSGNLRYGPWVYRSNIKDGIVGKVGDLKITSGRAVLSGPAGESLQAAEGHRTASFEDGVTVRRGRVTATGPKLVYSESTGLGVLEGPVIMIQTPDGKGGNPVKVDARQMAFNVETDVSTSTGEVRLVSGDQTGRAQKVYYQERRGLAVFSMPDGGKVTLIRTRKGGRSLVITAPEIRSLTRSKKLLATGGVTLKDGDITTTGTALYYDDATGIAIVVGQPAQSVNKKEGLTLRSGTLEQNVNLHTVRLYGRLFILPTQSFAVKGG